MSNTKTKSAEFFNTVLDVIVHPEKLLEYRFGRFAVVGGSGVIVNMLMLWVGVTWLFASMGDVTIDVAGAFAIGISIVTNFFLNDAWTWGDRAKKGLAHFFQRMGSYVLIASVAGVVQWVVLVVLSKQVGIAYLLANFVAIACGVVINYFANNAWTFRKREAGQKAS